jgi:hypothetical protein
MEPGGSLPYSQVADAGPYFEPNESSPHPYNQFLQYSFWYYPPIYVYVSYVVSSFQVSNQAFVWMSNSLMPM